MDAISNNSGITSQQLLNSLAFIKSAMTGKEVLASDLKENGRVNEQELYAAIVHQKLRQVSPEAAKQFKNDFAEALAKREHHSDGLILRTVRGLMEKISNTGLIGDLRNNIQQFALGKAQLDSNQTQLSDKDLTPGDKDTPVRTIKTALKLFNQNDVATDQEHTKFKKDLRSLVKTIKEEVAAEQSPTEPSGESTPPPANSTGPVKEPIDETPPPANSAPPTEEEIPSTPPPSESIDNSDSINPPPSRRRRRSSHRIPHGRQPSDLVGDDDKTKTIVTEMGDMMGTMMSFMKLMMDQMMAMIGLNSQASMIKPW